MRPLALLPRPGHLRRGVLVAAGVLTGGVFGLAWWVDRFGRREQAGLADALVVLGARVLPGGVPSGALVARVEQAAALYHRGVAPWLLLSGGVGVHPPSEARVMLELAVAAGVPASACVLEEQSHSTDDNARFSVRVLRERGARRVVVVSDPYHLLRARQCFRREGWEVATSPAPIAGRMRAWDRCYWTVREAFALLLRPHLLLARAPGGRTGGPGA
ncbi:YdcF family protein [Corallococcus praedator]|uniref:YdcF family protein n=1 Tax=Corallococcus praedator TaxID=2316724 RepID=A0ABX9QEP1_9BACT|nr:MULTISPECIES: YdcF family protein [Corallococcus]RKH24280.1 YdcF family protein [Corallococcus sp. CA031C]RKI00761.1 YdcF family protein [Corallococcus praedator]